MDKALRNVLPRCFKEEQNCESPKISTIEYLKLIGQNLKSTAQKMRGRPQRLFVKRNHGKG